MTTQLHVLSRLVIRYDERDAPVTPAEIARVVDADPETIREFFEDFESKHLLKPAGSGYRPTITARELLDLDLDDDATVILDAGPESE
jgi:predicted transcriptional regulator